MFKFLVLIIFILISFPILASPDPEPFVDFKAIEFNKDQVGIIFNNGTQNNAPDMDHLVYGAIENKNIKILTASEYKTQFPTVKSLDKFERNDPNQEYKLKYKGCVPSPEVEATCKSVDITVGKKVLNINFKKMKICDSCSIFYIEKWKNTLWIGFTFQSEYWLDGDGVYVLDITKKNNIKAVNSKFLATIIKKDPNGKIMWIGGPQGIEAYDENLKLIHSCALKHDSKVRNPESYHPYFDYSFNCTN
jgi:hypothetical protein